MITRVIRVIVLSIRGDTQIPMKPKEMIKLLEKNGFEQMSSNDSHRKMQNKATGTIYIVPYHNKDLAKGTEQNILKQAGLK